MFTDKFKVLIVDDELEARRLLRSILEEIPNVAIVAEADNAESALFELVRHYPNLIFLDMNMPGETGMELIDLINARHIDVPVAIVSGHEKFALQALRNGVYDFILKPVARDELRKIVEKHRRLKRRDLPSRLMELLQSIQEDRKIKINSKYRHILLQPAQIVYCKSDNGYTDIYMSNGKTETVSSSLTQIISRIDSANFHKLGRSLIINLDFLRAVDKTANVCTFKKESNEWQIQTSRKAIKKLLKSISNYA